MAKKTNPFVHGDVLAPLADPWTAQSLIYVVADGPRLQFILAHGGDETAPDFAHVAEPNLADVFVKPRRGSKEREEFETVENLTARLLGQTANGRARLDDVKAHVLGRSSLHLDFAERSLRMLVAQRTLIASETGQRTKRVELRLSAQARTMERRRAYAASFAHDLALQSEQIGQLIGHAPTVGSYREDLLRALIQRHIPKRFHAATGFIDGCPNQLDILIYDQIEYAPLFHAGDLVVVPPAAVRAIVEVKSNLTREELTDALAHLEMARPFRGSGPPVFTGVFAYDGAGVPTLNDTIRTFHRPAEDDDPIDGSVDFHQIGDIGQSVDAVCILQKTILISTFASVALGRGQSLMPQVIELESQAGRDFQAAVFFDYLSRFLRHPFGGERIDAGIGPIIAADVTIGASQLIYGDQYWGPYIEEEWVTPFEGRVAALQNWLAGKIWIEPPA